MPKEPLPANQHNPLGYWEPRELAAYHDELLSAAQSAWFDPRRLDLSLIEPELLEGMKRRMAELLLMDYGDTPLIALKDPRICRFVPLWLDVLHHTGRSVKAVMVVRHPTEVAASLRVRNRMNQRFVDLLWLRHMADAEAATRLIPRAVVTYDELHGHSHSAAERLSLLLNRPNETSDAVAERMESAIQPQHRHHFATNTPDGDPTAETRSAGLVYRAFLSLAEQDGAAARAALSEAVAAAEPTPALLLDAMMDELRNRTAEAEQRAEENGGLRLERDRMQAELEVQTEKVTQLQLEAASRERAEERLLQMEHEMAEARQLREKLEADLASERLSRAEGEREQAALSDPSNA
jgi:hypothetical protein